MKKIILTIIILAVAKSIFAAPSTYHDATRMQGTFTIAPNSDIQARRLALDLANTASATADTALQRAIAEITGNDALDKIKTINALILDKGSCLYNATDCTQDNVDYIPSEAFSGLLLGDPGKTYIWEAPAGVTSVDLRLRGGGGGGAIYDSGNTWFGGPSGNVIAFGGDDRTIRGTLRGQSVEVRKTVIVTPGQKINYHKGSPEYLNSGTTLKHPEGTIHMTYKVKR